MERVSHERSRLNAIAAVTAVLIAAALAIIGPPEASAGLDARFASPDGENTDACTEANPCDIRTAVDGALNGQQIRLIPGLYDVGVVGLQLDNSNELIPDSRAGLVSIGSADSLSPTLSVVGPSSVKDVSVTSQGASPPAALFLSGGGALADRVFARTVGPAAPCDVDDGVLRNSVCFNSTPEPDVITDPEPGPALTTTVIDDEAASPMLRGVTAFSLAGAGLNLEAGQNATLDIDARNSIFSGLDDAAATRDIVSSGDGALTADIDFSNYSSVDDGVATGTIPQPGSADNQQADPALRNPEQGNFAETEDSPTIDAGDDSASDLGALDLAARTRIVGEAIDIGAYEVQADQPPPQGNPTVTIRRKPARRTKSRKATFRFRAGDAAGPFEFRCKLDDKQARPCNSPQTYRNLARRKHEFRVTAITESGRRGSARYSWRIK